MGRYNYNNYDDPPRYRCSCCGTLLGEMGAVWCEICEKVLCDECGWECTSCGNYVCEQCGDGELYCLRCNTEYCKSCIEEHNHSYFINRIEGIGRKTGDLILDSGITEEKSLYSLKLDELVKIKGIGKKVAEKILKYYLEKSTINIKEKFGTLIPNVDKIENDTYGYVEFKGKIIGLGLCNCNILNFSKINGIKELTDLQYLNLANNRLKECIDISPFPKLLYLNVSNNPINSPPDLHLDNIDEIKMFNKEMEQWNPRKVYEKLKKNMELSWIDKNHPQFKEYFQNLKVNDPESIKSFLKWDVKIIIEKLLNNEYPSTYDLNHYLFKTQWRELEQFCETQEHKNDQIIKISKYIVDTYSVKGKEGLKILL